MNSMDCFVRIQVTHRCTVRKLPHHLKHNTPLVHSLRVTGTYQCVCVTSPTGSMIQEESKAAEERGVMNEVRKGERASG
eukprot:m.219344 g.219344  ORF g.219344 m.219344 type:complete len:79 (+) comp25751_c2_seq1:386-622(+)